MKKVLVTGANGQLGRCIRETATSFAGLSFHFASRDILDIGDPRAMKAFFDVNSFDYCINTAAYTLVDKAENEKDEAFKINAIAVKELVSLCVEQQITLLHVSTDYVFDGESTEPYSERDPTHPIGVYGASKLQGEKYIESGMSRYFILRTSWLYSQYGHNFINTILKHARAGNQLSITTEQTGTPTNANDLAWALLHIIQSGSEAYGLYHFSNGGTATWYDFAVAILEHTEDLDPSLVISTHHYPTLAKRPKYSILNTSKFVNTFSMNPLPWEDSLVNVIKKYG